MKNANPVISVDATKKELICEFKNSGKTWNKVVGANEVNFYGFLNPGLGKAAPYGI
jgi:hypothetical protein